MSALLLERVRAAVDDGRLRPLELALADWCLRHGGSAAVALGMALAARAVHEGHSCLPLPAEGPALPGETPWCDAATFAAALQTSDLVGAPGEARPLIVDDGRLYLHRYHDYESRLARQMRAWVGAAADDVDATPLLDGGLFDYSWVDAAQTHWQAVAAFVALRQRFAVISGGPGTGKTYVVLRLMRLLIEAALARGAQPPVIVMAAPTGKAAARMVDSTRAGLSGMTDLPPSVQAHIPDEARTLHRLLGLRRGSTRPRHDAENPLAADIVIVDEASMVDLPMMAKLADALPAAGRLIMLGDRYQLTSVESGSVLAEICDAAGVNTFSAGQITAAGALLRADAPPPDAGHGLGDHVVTLQTSHRFSPDSAIGRAAAAINAGDSASLVAVFDGSQGDIRNAAHVEDAVRLEAAVGEHRHRALIAAAVKAAAPLFAPGLEPARALADLDRHRILTATRIGPDGAEALNADITAALALEHGFDPARRWYHGRAVLVTENDYRARLFNGDSGIALTDAEGRLRVWFAGEAGLRSFLPSALPAHQSAWAMTVHKSQGSEFDTVTLVLPETDVPVLTRELLYTGITRARRHVTLWAQPQVLAAAITRRSIRFSGLAARLRK